MNTSHGAFWPSDEGTTKDTAAAPAMPCVRRFALLGGVGVGKTALFERLCTEGGHSVDIAHSPLEAMRGVVAVGPAGASRALRRHCATCGTGHRAKAPSPCLDSSQAASQCPGRKPRRLTVLEQDAAQSKRSWPEVIHLYDTPGATSLVAGSEDEMVARDLLLSGQMDGVLLVADPKNLRRSLALGLEVAEFGLPMVVDLNLLDEAENQGLSVDDRALGKSLGVPVGRTVAIEKGGSAG